MATTSAVVESEAAQTEEAEQAPTVPYRPEMRHRFFRMSEDWQPPHWCLQYCWWQEDGKDKINDTKQGIKKHKEK